MKKYNIKNYIRYKKDISNSIRNIPLKTNFADYTTKELKNIIFTSRRKYFKKILYISTSVWCYEYYGYNTSRQHGFNFSS